MSPTKDKKSFGSGFLYAEDLIRGGDFQEFKVVISAVHEPGTIRQADGSLINKTVLEFEKATKKLCLCKTNKSILCYVCGDQSGPNWIGKQITLQARIVDSFGAKVAAVRVIPPNGIKIRKKLIERLGSKATLKS